LPHIVIEYSANLENRIELRELVRKTHEAALATGVFEVGGLRTRCARRDVYRVADGHPDNAFVTVNVRVGHGRDEATRHRAGKTIFEAVCAHAPRKLTLHYSLFFAIDPSHRGILVMRNGPAVSTAVLSPENAEIDLLR